MSKIYQKNLYDQILDDLKRHKKTDSDKEIKKFFASIQDTASELYWNLQEDKVEVDYSDIELQIAYVIRYFPGYWQQIYSSLNMIDDFQNEYFSNQSNLNIGIFGCGPCPEIIGITKFFEKRKKNFKVNPKKYNLYLLDKFYKKWSFARKTFIYPQKRYSALKKFGFSLYGLEYDISKIGSQLPNMHHLHIFCFQNCLNEILDSAELDALKINFNNLAKCLEDGGYLIITDRNRSLVDRFEDLLLNQNSESSVNFTFVDQSQNNYDIKKHSPLPKTSIFRHLLNGDGDMRLIPTNTNYSYIRIYQRSNAIYSDKLNNIFAEAYSKKK